MKTENRHIGSGVAMVQVRSFVFGEIVKRVFPHIEIYHSDLYHVATALPSIIPDNTVLREFRFTVVGEPAGCAIERHHGGVTERSYLSHRTATIYRFTVKGDRPQLRLCRWDVEIQSTE